MLGVVDSALGQLIMSVVFYCFSKELLVIFLQRKVVSGHMCEHPLLLRLHIGKIWLNRTQNCFAFIHWCHSLKPKDFICSASHLCFFNQKSRPIVSVWVILVNNTVLQEFGSVFKDISVLGSGQNTHRFGRFDFGLKWLCITINLLFTGGQTQEGIVGKFSLFFLNDVKLR